MKQVIHKNALNLFMNIARLSGSIELEMSRRQLVMKDRHEHILRIF